MLTNQVHWYKYGLIQKNCRALSKYNDVCECSLLVLNDIGFPFILVLPGIIQRSFILE